MARDERVVPMIFVSQGLYVNWREPIFSQL